MAGDWLKVEICTPDKAEVFAMAEALGIDADAVVGKLFRVWAWFDQHTEKGNAASVTTSLIDRCASMPGFANAMLAVGWMTQGHRGLELPNFDRHNGKTAKTRALTAKRVAGHKQRTGNGQLTLVALPREEKRSTPHSPPLNGKRKIATPPPEAFEITEPMWSWVRELGLPDAKIEPETAKFLDHHRSKGTSFKDWDAAWRTWMRKAVEYSAVARH